MLGRVITSLSAVPSLKVLKKLPGARQVARYGRQRQVRAQLEELRSGARSLASHIYEKPFVDVLLKEGEYESDRFNHTGRDFAVVEINNTCNIDCLMCKTSLSTRQKGVVKDTTFEAALDQLSAIGVDRITLHTIGDPLANPRLGEFLATLAQRDIKANLSTNGLLLRKHYGALLEHMEVCSHLRFSIDGATKETYELIRAGGEWEELLDNLDLFQRELRPRGYDTSINMTISADNVGEVGEFVRLFSGYVDEAYRDLHFGFVNSLSPDTDYFHKVNLFPNHTYQNAPCKFVTQPLPYVLIDGRVTICCRDYDGSMTLGDILTEDLQEIHQGSSLEALREAHRTGNLEDYPLCATCYLVDRRLDSALARLMRYLIFHKPNASAAFFQDRVDRFVSLFSGTDSDGVPQSYADLYAL